MYLEAMSYLHWQFGIRKVSMALEFCGGSLSLLSLGKKHLDFYFFFITKNHIIKYTINLVWQCPNNSCQILHP